MKARIIHVLACLLILSCIGYVYADTTITVVNEHFQISIVVPDESQVTINKGFEGSKVLLKIYLTEENKIGVYKLE